MSLFVVYKIHRRKILKNTAAYILGYMVHGKFLHQSKLATAKIAAKGNFDPMEFSLIIPRLIDFM